MHRIPTFIPPMKDELLYSYLLRLSKANGYDDYAMFHRLFIETNRYNEKRIPRNKCLRYDSSIRLKDFFHSLEQYIWDINSVEFFLDHSFYGAISPLMNDYQQTAFINWVFDNAGTHSVFSPAPYPLIKHLMFCPQCRESELKEYGYSWFHRVHQMPDIKVCPAHKTPLLQCISAKGNEFSELKYQSIYNIDDMELEYKYSLFVQEFIDAGINANLKDIKRAVAGRKEAISQQYALNMPQAIERHVSENKKINKLSESALSKLYSTYARDNNKREAKNEYMLMLFAIFDHPSEIISYLPEYENKERVMEILHDNNYALISLYRKNLIKIRHNICGATMHSTPDAVMKGWFCPQCDADTSNDNFIKRMVSLVTDDEYKVLESCSNMTDRMKLKHKKCDAEYLVRANSFIQLGSRCDCLRRITYEKAKNAVEANPEFKLIAFEAASAPMTILHSSCNHTFHRTYFSSKLHACPYCIQNNLDKNKEDKAGYKLTPRGFRSIVEDLVGKEYTLLDDYRGINVPIEMRHNICGTIQQYYPFDFKRGYRCKHCTPVLTTDYMQSAVSQISGNIYHAEPASKKNYYVIKDQQDNPVTTMLDKTILQELRRPTKSDLLPLDRHYPFHYIPAVSDKESVIKWLSEAENTKTWFSASEISSTLDVPVNKVYRLLKEIKEVGVYRLHRYFDLYAFESYDIQTVLQERFIRSGKELYGVLSGDSFLNAIGYLSGEIKDICILSDRLETKTLIIKDKGIKYIIKKSNQPMTTESVLVIPVLELFNKAETQTNQRLIECCKEYCHNQNIPLDIFEKYSEGYECAFERISKLVYLSGNSNN